MIILSVIVVGTAIATGIQMFDRQYENQTRLAQANEVLRLAQMCKAWYRTPVAMGGFGNGRNPVTGEMEPLTDAFMDQLAKYLNSAAARVYSGTPPEWRNEMGRFQVYQNVTTFGSEAVKVTCWANANGAWETSCTVDIRSSDPPRQVFQG